MDEFLRNNVLGKGFGKLRLIYSGGDFGILPRRGGVWGGIHAGILFGF